MDELRPDDPRRIGPYRVQGRLGEGGMGEVFLARSPAGRAVVIKRIHRHHASKAEFRARFAREIDAARRVGGFHTAQVVEADPDAASPWMATAYIPGPSLSDFVAEHGPLPADMLRTLAAGLTEGLAAIHACGLVHRDLKPSNVILADDGPRIIDFGIARPMDGGTLTGSGVVIGTYTYMSPEQIQGDPVTPASDVFSLGCVLAFAASGTSPFHAETLPAIALRIITHEPDLDQVPHEHGLRGLVASCLAKTPADRPTLDEILTRLTESGSEPQWSLVLPPRAAPTPSPADPAPPPPAEPTPPPAEPALPPSAEPGPSPAEPALPTSALPTSALPASAEPHPTRVQSPVSPPTGPGPSPAEPSVPPPTPWPADPGAREPSSGASPKVTLSSPASDPSVTDIEHIHPTSPRKPNRRRLLLIAGLGAIAVPAVAVALTLQGPQDDPGAAAESTAPSASAASAAPISGSPAPASVSPTSASPSASASPGAGGETPSAEGRLTLEMASEEQSRLGKTTDKLRARQETLEKTETPSGLAGRQKRLMQLTSLRGDLTAHAEAINSARMRVISERDALIARSEAAADQAERDDLVGQAKGLEAVDRLLEVELREIDTMRDAVETEINALRRVIGRDVDESFRTFG